MPRIFHKEGNQPVIINNKNKQHTVKLIIKINNIKFPRFFDNNNYNVGNIFRTGGSHSSHSYYLCSRKKQEAYSVKFNFKIFLILSNNIEKE
jgi:hypothetical protein